MTTEEWAILGVLVLVAVGVIAALTVPTANYASPPKPAVNLSPSLTPTPQWTPAKTPTARTPTPTATPVPTPDPCLTRWCDATGCYCGTAPTPTPIPTATPTPAPTATPKPLWFTEGLACEVPDSMVNEPWVRGTYRFNCTCLIRGKWDLGVNFNVFEACFSSTATAWRRDSCDCVEVICKATPRLC